ncbi:hypothetical protein K1T71_012407, partial [Dendrolimus kikuchii]
EKQKDNKLYIRRIADKQRTGISALEEENPIKLEDTSILRKDILATGGQVTWTTESSLDIFGENYFYRL